MLKYLKITIDNKKTTFSGSTSLDKKKAIK